MKRVLAVLLAWVGVALHAQASRYEIPLPELKGVYSTGDLAPWTFSLAGEPLVLPVSLKRIDAIYVDVTGNVAPARYRNTTGESVEFNRNPSLLFQIAWNDGSNVYWFLDDAIVQISPNGPFHVVEEFHDPVGDPPNWGRMLASPNKGFDFYIEPDTSQGIEQVIPAIAGITDAKLIIEGEAVPEPAGIMVLAIGGLALLSRRRSGSARA